MPQRARHETSHDQQYLASPTQQPVTRHDEPQRTGGGQLRQIGHEQKPRLRGALHAVALPVAAVAGAVLIGTAPTPLARLAAGIFAATSVLLFGVSAAYHRARCTPRVRAVLHRCDHANIYGPQSDGVTMPRARQIR